MIHHTNKRCYIIFGIFITLYCIFCIIYIIVIIYSAADDVKANNFYVGDVFEFVPYFMFIFVFFDIINYGKLQWIQLILH